MYRVDYTSDKDKAVLIRQARGRESLLMSLTIRTDIRDMTEVK